MILPRMPLHLLFLFALLLGVPAMTSTAMLNIWWWAIIGMNSLLIADAILLTVRHQIPDWSLPLPGSRGDYSPLSFWRKAGH